MYRHLPVEHGFEHTTSRRLVAWNRVAADVVLPLAARKLALAHSRRPSLAAVDETRAGVTPFGNHDQWSVTAQESADELQSAPAARAPAAEPAGLARQVGVRRGRHQHEHQPRPFDVGGEASHGIAELSHKHFA
eukprot:7281213-Prymnesium_polylepis.1